MRPVAEGLCGRERVVAIAAGSEQLMAIKCDMCSRDIVFSGVHGAVLYAPSDELLMCRKYDICKDCFDTVFKVLIHNTRLDPNQSK
jgi:hypothetical protein